MVRPHPTVLPGVGIMRDCRITLNHARQVARSVVVTMTRLFGKGSRATELVCDGEVRSLAETGTRPCDEFPAALSQEPMVTTGNKFGPVRQDDAERLLDRLPVRLHVCDDKPTIVAEPFSSI